MVNKKSYYKSTMTKVFEEKCPVCGMPIIGRSQKQAEYNLQVHKKACKLKRKKIEDRIKILKSKL